METPRIDGGKSLVNGPKPVETRLVLHFVKMHGAGNDYVFVDAFADRIEDRSGLAREISDRRRGVGSDGLIVIGPSEKATAFMDIYNRDGSRATMCGNGIRCVGKYLVDRRRAERRLTIETLGGTYSLEVSPSHGKASRVEVEMGTPRVIRDGPRGGCQVDVGNPHIVFGVDDVMSFDLETEAQSLQTELSANVSIVEPISDRVIRQRTYELGSGATAACGTGAVAGATFHAQRKKVDAVEVQMPGGTLAVRFDQGVAFLAGDAVEVFRGEWPLRREKSSSA